MNIEVLYLGNVIDVHDSWLIPGYVNVGDIIIIDEIQYVVAEKIIDFKKDLIQIIVNRR